MNSILFEELETADVTLACDDDERIQAHLYIRVTVSCLKNLRLLMLLLNVMMMNESKLTNVFM